MRCLRFLVPVGITVPALILGGAIQAAALVQIKGEPTDPTCPPIPDSFDVDLAEEDWSQVAQGEIIVRSVKHDDGNRQAQAVGYLNADPVWLFDLATDPSFTTRLVELIEEVEVLETRPTGRVVRGVADVSFFIPSFEYTFVSAYLATKTGLCWAQREGDFAKNEGAHSYLWDPQRQQTLAVFMFDFAMKGVLRLIPEALIVKLTGRTLPGFMRSIESLIPEVRERDPERAARNDAVWADLKSRLEAGELPGRVWRGVGDDGG